MEELALLDCSTEASRSENCSARKSSGDVARMFHMVRRLVAGPADLDTPQPRNQKWNPKAQTLSVTARCLNDCDY